MQAKFFNDERTILQQRRSYISKHLLLGLIVIVIVTILGFSLLLNNQWNNHKIRIYKMLRIPTLETSITTENREKRYHKVIIWVAAYDPLNNRDQYVLHHLAMAKNICESSIPNSFVRLFIGTRSKTWNTNQIFQKFRNRNSHDITPIANTNLSHDFIIIEHFKWSCVEFIIGYYEADLQLALPFQHRKYFQQHINEFDWFWFTEDDSLYDNRIYWKLMEETSFAFNKLSSTETHDLLSLYASKGKKPKILFGRYFFLPTLLRFEKPVNYKNISAIRFTDNLDLWRLSEMGLCCQPLIEAIIFYNEQWWLQSTNSHSAYYILPREHLRLIVRDRNWLNTTKVTDRDWTASYWLLDFGYIRVTSITNLDQYLVHHASNKYYDHPYNLPKVSTIIGGWGFEYKNDHFFPTTRLTDAHLLKYTVNHSNDIGSCFPLSFSPIPKRRHEATPVCSKLLKISRTD
jgi:hypothetical protein